jgi:predicted transposase YbfD/YdcC
MTKPRLKLDATAFLEHFGTLEDPRKETMCDHLLVDLLVIAILATICGADGWTEIHAFGESKEAFLRTLLALPNGIPSVNTFQRVFARLHPQRFEAAFRGWTSHLVDHSNGRLIAVDGKTLRGVVKRSLKRLGLHLVHAWAVGNRLLLGQFATKAKSNEITAIPELLALLDLAGAVVTIDAMGCQTAIAAQIIAAKGDYILAVKENQPTLFAAVTAQVAQATARTPTVPSSTATDHGQGHGRIERRRIVAAPAPTGPATARWVGLASCILIESERRQDGVVTRECKYFITSLPHHDAGALGQSIRGHWSVENLLHWQLDVAFHEDACTVSAGHGAENLSLLRKIALTALTRETSPKLGVAARRKRAGWDDNYLLQVLAHGITG